jgi:hypothetical protein
MSHLIEEYAKSCGVKIGKPKIKAHYFPIPYEKYITVHNDKIVQAKEYSFWPRVIEILKPILNKQNIKIIQIGANGEDTINGVDKHMPTNTMKQCFYIIQNSLGHMGIDSLPVHVASAFDKPIVSIYAHTHVKTCNPYWNEKSKTICLESHRNGNKPSFSLQENPKTIDLIYPEKIAESLLEVLDIDEKINFKTINIGARYGQECMEVILSNEKCNLISNFINVRMDINHNEQALYYILRRNNVEVTLTRPIDDELLFSKKIKTINYVAEEFDIEFVKKIKKSGVNLTLLCTSKEKLAQQRFNLFDFMVHLLEINEIIKTNKEKLPNLNLKKTKVQSNKKIICGDKVYETYYDFNSRKNEDDFFLDLDWFYLYNDQHE